MASDRYTYLKWALPTIDQQKCKKNWKPYLKTTNADCETHLKSPHNNADISKT